ncbi:MAG: hypothetical protein AB7R69_02265 [Candidatus Babeliales bacterium]
MNFYQILSLIAMLFVHREIDCSQTQSKPSKPSDADIQQQTKQKVYKIHSFHCCPMPHPKEIQCPQQKKRNSAPN